MNRQVQKDEDQYHHLHQSGKRVRRVKQKPIESYFSSVPNTVNLNSKVKIECSRISEDLKILLIDVIQRGYHPLHENEFLTSSMRDKQNSIIQEEAINIIWGCIGRELGKTFFPESIIPIKREIYERLNEIDSRSELSRRVYSKAMKEGGTKKMAEEYQKLANQRKQLRQEIEKLMQKKTKQFYSIEKKILNQNRIIVEQLRQDIISTQNQVFKNTLVCIEVSGDEASLIFEQCYPTITMDVKNAINFVGEKLFNEKCEKYNWIIKQRKGFNFCHFCLMPVTQTGSKKCDNRVARANVQNLILTDPYVFYENILCEYVPKNEENTQYIHPYLKYYKISKTQKKYICNRYICNECFMRYYTGSYETCEYCEGTCDCPRCGSMDYLTKAIGLYFSYSEDLEKGKQIFSFFKMNFAINYLSMRQIIKNSAKTDRFKIFLKTICQESEDDQWEKRLKYEPRVGKEREEKEERSQRSKREEVEKEKKDERREDRIKKKAAEKEDKRKKKNRSNQKIKQRKDTEKKKKESLVKLSSISEESPLRSDIFEDSDS